LDELRTGELGQEVASEVESHMERCPSCDHTFDAIAALAEHAKTAAPVLRKGSVLKAVRAALTDSMDEVVVGERRAWVAFTDDGVTMLHDGSAGEESLRRHYRARYHRELLRRDLPVALRSEIEQGLRGAASGEPHVDVASRISPFDLAVLRATLSIPRGEVRPYAWIANAIGRPGAVRAVGNALARNPVPTLLPCHRVVPLEGGVGNYVFGSEWKRELLQAEGVPLGELESLATRGVRYVASATTKIYCFPTCRDARRIRRENRVELRDEADAAERGYRACKHCRPMTRTA
jgi:O-6-methylguanine DNA methyltransferase